MERFKTPFTMTMKKNWIFRNNFNTAKYKYIWGKLLKTPGRHRNRPKQMKKHPQFLVRTTQRCKDVSSPEVYKFNTILIKIPASYFMELSKLVLKFTWTKQISKSSQENTETLLREEEPCQILKHTVKLLYLHCFVAMLNR